MDNKPESQQQQQESINFDVNYNQNQFLQQNNANNKIQKLSIMNDFNQLCQKMNLNSGQVKDQSEDQNSQNPLTQYYKKIKQLNISGQNALKNDKDKTCKNQNTNANVTTKNTPNAQILENNSIKLNVNQTNPIIKTASPPYQHTHSISDNYHPMQYSKQSPSTKLIKSNHERNPSQGLDNNSQHGQTYTWKILSVPQAIENKRNYSSVQEKKQKILLPTKNTLPSNYSSHNYNTQEVSTTNNYNSSNNYNQQNNTVKDYFGEEDNFVNRKVHGKNFISTSNQSKNNQKILSTNKDQKEKGIINSKKPTISTNNSNLIIGSHNQVLNGKYSKGQNCMKESNLLTKNTICQRGSVNQKDNSKNDKTLLNSQKPSQQLLKVSKKAQTQKPQIRLYKRVINLGQSAQNIIEAFKNQQMRSDYQIFSQSESTIDEGGLFAKAIVHKRTKTAVQNVQPISPLNVSNNNYSGLTTFNYLQHNNTYKQSSSSANIYQSKHNIPSPMNINLSPNTLTGGHIMNGNFQKRQNPYR